MKSKEVSRSQCVGRRALLNVWVFAITDGRCDKRLLCVALAANSQCQRRGRVKVRLNLS